MTAASWRRSPWEVDPLSWFVSPNLPLASAGLVLAHGVLILGPAEGMALIERLPDVDGVIVTADNQVLVSSGLKALVTITHPPTEGP